MKTYLSLLVSLAFVACATPSSTPEIAAYDDAVLEPTECYQQSLERSPSAAKTCSSLFEKSGRRSKEELERERSEVIAGVETRMKEIEQFAQSEPLGLWAVLLGPEQVKEAVARNSHPIEFLPEKQIMSFAKAWSRLRDIPDTRFVLTSELARDVNKLMLGDLNTRLMNQLSPDLYRDATQRTTLQNFVINQLKPMVSGAGRLRTSKRKLDFTKKSLSESEFQTLKTNANALGLGFEETSYSTEGNRTALVELVPPKAIAAEMDRLFEWADQKANTLRNSDRNGILDFVADLHLRFAALEPFANGNTATTQLLINRVLLQLRLPPSVQIAVELTYSKEQVKDLYRDGLEDYVKLTLLTTKNKKFAYKEAASVMGRSAGTRLVMNEAEKELFARVREITRPRGELTPENSGQIFRFGKEDREFIIADDGVIYDTKLTPHVIRQEGGRLRIYPISFKSYIFMGYNGKATELKGVKRDPTPEHIEYATLNRQTVERLLGGGIKGEDVEVVYDAKVLEANKTGEPHFHAWQIPVLRRAIRISDDPVADPYHVLANGRGEAIEPLKGGRTEFERKFFLGWSGIRVGDVIGQYETKDIEYAKLGMYIKKNDLPGVSASEKQEMLKEVYESRRALHKAARQILKPLFDKLKMMTAESLQSLRQNTHFDGTEKFLLKYSKLGQEDFDLAIRAFGEYNVYVIRSMTGKIVKFLGFRTQADFRAMLESVNVNRGFEGLLKTLYADMKGGSGTSGTGLASGVRKKIATFANGNGAVKGFVESVTQRIFVSEYETKRTEAEFKSEYITQYLHAAINDGMKTGLSTTVNPSLLFDVKMWADKVEQGPSKKEVEHFGSRQKAIEYFKVMADKEAKGQLSPDESAILFNVDTADSDEKAATKFSKQPDATVYFMRVPIDDVDIAYPSLWRNQYEIYLKRGYGWLRSHWQVIRETMPRNLLGRVNVAGLTPQAREVWDLLRTPLNSSGTAPAADDSTDTQ